MNIDPLRPYLSAIKAGAVVIGVLLVFAFGYNRGADKWEGKYDNEALAHKATKASHKAVIDNLAALTKAAEGKAKTASAAVKRDQAQADKRYRDATNEAKRNAADLRDALRSGKQRLSDTWACPASASNGDAADLAGQAGTAGQHDSAARIAAAADADAAAMNWLWDRWMADRKAVIDAGCAVEARP